MPFQLQLGSLAPYLTTSQLSVRHVFVSVAALLVTLAVWEQLSLKFRVARMQKNSTSSLAIAGPSWVVPFLGSIVSMVMNPTAFWHGHFALSSVTWDSLLGQLTVIVNDASCVRKIFMSCSDRMPLALHPNAYTLLGRDNFAFINGEHHRALRRSLLPFFTTRALGMYVDLQVKAIRKHMQQWADMKATAQQPLVMRPLIYDLNTYTSMTVFLGPYLTTESRKSLTHDYQMLTEGIFGFPINLPGFALYRGAQARVRVLAALTKIADMSKAAMAMPNAEPKCMIDFWMKDVIEQDASGSDNAGDSASVTGHEPTHGHTDSHSCAKIMLDFLFASQDASTSSLTFTTHVMTQRPDVLERVRAEVKAVHQAQMQAEPDISGEPQPQVQGEGAELKQPSRLRLDADVLRSLPYTTQVVKEVLRLYPPGTIVPHRTTQPFTLEQKDGSITIPSGSLVVPSIWSSNRTGFSSPDEFDPDRWSMERGEGKKYAANYLVFGVGPHACLGVRYAMNHLVAFLTLLAYESEFTRLDTPIMHNIKYLPTIYPEDDCPIKKFTLRHTSTTHHC